MIIAGLLLWMGTGLYLTYKEKIVFNFAMHVRYPNTVPKVKDPFESDPGSLLAGSLLGPFAATLMFSGASFLPADYTLRQALAAKAGRRYPPSKKSDY